MRRIFTIVAALALALGAGLWLVLIATPTAEIAEMGEGLTSALIFAGGLAALAGLTVALFGDLDCLRFYGAVSAVIALLGIAAFYSTRTHGQRERENLLQNPPASEFLASRDAGS